MKRILLIISFVFSLSHASGTYDGVYFDDYEENASLYFCNYYPYQSFLDIGIASTYAKTIPNNRPYTNLLQVSSLTGINATYMDYIRANSHIIDWNVYTNEFGMTLHQTNFLYALSGVLFGFSFLFMSLYLASRRK